ncbi:peptidoglycan-binding domain-containing protein [Pelagibacterium xiamenense]|uniref:peptidoglycan-binding domain-containing protein n=1 Tax=Pelagibacterium xiamenense TaxID=2901140 RepID=UPI001E3CDA8B|nr:peptidoglycan-binding protein [Pelagibacterium xiamenense]MCD7059431.1 peptidoglycan-binding protein [Pelagibacterium xiamenense]
MNQTSTASMPMAIGNALFSLVGRGVAWGAGKMMHAPMTSTGVIVVTGLSMMASANALFLQDGYHPAPMFGAPAISRPEPVEPVIERPADLTPAPQPVAERASAPDQPVPQETATAPQTQEADAPVPIGNEDIAELQSKLKAMGLFDGVVDGYYGPKTADAIRAFEGRAGLPRTGAATPEVMEAVRNAPATTSEAPAAQPQTSAQPMPAPVTSEPAGQDIAALIASSETAPAPAASQQAEVPLFDPSTSRPAEAVAQTAEAPAADPVPAALDRALVSTVQRGLAQLGFLQAPVDGVAGASTAEAIRKFEIFHNYRTTGQVSRDLVDMLEAAGADI